MRLFENTLQGFERYFDAQKKTVSVNEMFSGSQDLLKAVNTSFSTQQKSPLILKFDENELKRYFSPSPHRFGQITIGDHPDFDYLDHETTLKHHAASMFVDIKGSTRLIEVVSDLEELRRIKDTILTLTIHVVHFFGGHIQRLQGDGVFAIFTRKDGHPMDSCVGALNAASVLSQFVKNEFAEVMKSMGMQRPISIRTGIDFGYDDQVLWSRYGIPGCEELTTTSLHTDLAAKLQQRAPRNGIIIGDNLKQLIDLDGRYLSVKEYQSGGEKKLLPALFPSSGITYKMHVFNWEKYLTSYSFAYWDEEKQQIVFKEPQKRLRCHIKNHGTDYSENSYALEKDLDLEFSLLDKAGNPLNNYPKQKIDWKIVNTGEEALASENLEIPLPITDPYQTSVIVNTSYLGQHKLQCKIRNTSGFGTESTIEFSVFVKK